MSALHENLGSSSMHASMYILRSDMSWPNLSTGRGLFVVTKWQRPWWCFIWRDHIIIVILDLKWIYCRYLPEDSWDCVCVCLDSVITVTLLPLFYLSKITFFFLTTSEIWTLLLLLCAFPFLPGCDDIVLGSPALWWLGERQGSSTGL